MIRHIVVAALRNMAANKVATAIATAGLSVGIAAALLMALVIRNQLSFDHFIPGYARVYAGVSELAIPGHPPVYNNVTHRNTAALLKLNVPEIEAVTRLMPTQIEPMGGGVILKRGDVTAREVIYWAEPNLAAVLPLPVFRGDLATALARPDGIVLTRTIARKYFGGDDVVGRTIALNGHPMTVRAVIVDLPQAGTVLASGIFASSLASFSDFATDTPDRKGDFSISVETYLRLKPEATIAAAEKRLPDLVNRLAGGVEVAGGRIPYAMSLQRIDRLNLFEGLNPGARTRLAVEGLVGLLVLFIAAVNFINLLTARAGRRAREVGVRKACGAGHRALMAQFLGEAVLTVAFATCVAAALAEWLLPGVNAFLQSGANFGQWRDPSLLLGLLAGVGLLGVAAGAYPAFLLSTFRPARTLKDGAFQPEGAGLIRNVLTGLQFSILLVLVVATIVVLQQRLYAVNEGLRVNVDQMLVVNRSCEPSFRSELRKLPGVAGVSCTDRSFLTNGSVNAIIYKGARVTLDVTRVDPGIFALYRITPLAGSLATANPQGDFDAASPRDVILNAAAVKRLGFTSPAVAIGQTIPDPGQSAPAAVPRRIAAVVPDFAFYSVERPMEPTAYLPAPPETSHGNGLVSIRLRGQAIPDTLAAIDHLWSATGNKGPIDRFFLDAHMREIYDGMVRQGELLAIFSGIAVLLACLGLFGIAISTAERRIKEIGVRKAMGAGNRQIVALLLWQFAQPVLWANVIAWPVAWWLMRRWLAGFAYHVDLHWWVFAAASLGALAIALLTVAGQAWATARQKPVLALRYE